MFGAGAAAARRFGVSIEKVAITELLLRQLTGDDDF
jgi:hypothetical protein